MTEYMFFGIVTALIFMEITGISPGGVIVPAYCAMYLYEPRRLGSTIVLAMICMMAVRLLSSFMILYGRRRFAFFLLTGIVIKVVLDALYATFGYAGGLSIYSIGFLIPGLLAKDMEKQGITKTLLSLTVVSCITRIICIIV